MTDPQSFQDVRNWNTNVETHSQPGVYRLLVGNKTDSGERAVETQQGRDLAEDLGIKFFETSAKANINVDCVFETAASDLLTKLLHVKEPDPTLRSLTLRSQTLVHQKQKPKPCC